jgi:hypothetical protein
MGTDNGEGGEAQGIGPDGLALPLDRGALQENARRKGQRCREAVTQTIHLTSSRDTFKTRRADRSLPKDGQVEAFFGGVK